MEIPSYAMPPHTGDRIRQAFCPPQDARWGWNFELFISTATSTVTRWQEPLPQRTARRVDVRQDQAELADALRAANPERWSDHALAELLGIDLAAVEALTPAEAISCHAA